MAGKRVSRGDLAPLDQQAIIQELANGLLDEQGSTAAPGWETIRRRIEAEVKGQSGPLLSLAQENFNAFESTRERAVQAYGRPDPASFGITAALAAYLTCLLLFPWHGIGLTPAIIAVLGVPLAIRLPMWRLRRERLVQAVPAADAHWRKVLREEVLQPFILEKRNEQDQRLLDTRIGDGASPEFVEGPDPKSLVITEAMGQVRATARNIHSGSLGISGPQGAGKSTILQFFGSGVDDGIDIRLVVSAPVDYDPRDFIIHLFSQLCLVVPHDPADRSPIAAETRRHIEELRYLRTYTTNWSSTLTPAAIFNLGWGRARQSVEQPITLPELVDKFRDYSAKVAAWHRSGKGPHARVVIGIDEMDKIRDSEHAEGFLNDIKAIFGVRGCLYIVSLSEEALADFSHRTPAIRSAFNTAFDEIVSVEPMAYEHSEQLLFKRIVDVPRPFLALGHVLAGGMPRDLVRAARALVEVTQAPGEKTLSATTRALVKRALESARQESIPKLAKNGAPGALLAELHRRQWPGASTDDFTQAARRLVGAVPDEAGQQVCLDLVVTLSFYSTVIELFGPAPDHLLGCLKEERYAVVDDLAAVRHAMRVNSGLAHHRLEQYRQHNGIGRGHASQ